ncbi:MAG: outer membrane beta-barrel protein [Xanthobacteraceae bacterium]|nr:outer membrane beta-barrel protein [Xanthobacteraceae bacterium]
MSAGLCVLVFAGAAQAQTSAENIPSIADRLLDSPRVTGAVPPNGAGQTGYVSQKKKAPPKKKQAQKKIIQTPPAPPAEPNLIVRNPSLLRAQQTTASPEITGTISPLRRRRPPQDDEPFGAPGFHAGTFLLRPSIELQAGFDSNAEKVANGKGSWFETVQGQLQGKSEWQRHEMTFDLRGAYTAYDSVDGVDRPDVQALVKTRLDVAARTKIELESKFSLTTENPGSPDAIASVRRQPNVYTFGQTAALVQHFNRFELTAGVGIERNVYENAELTNGTVTSLADRDYNAYSARLRGTYEWSPDVKPFVEVSMDRRERDLPVDFSGVMRNSDGYTLRAGITFGRKDWLYGDVSIGFSHRSYADPSLADVQGMIYDASLVWLATGLTTFKLNAASGIDETSVPGASGVLRHEAKLTIEHALRRWLVASVSVGWLSEEYEGTSLVNDYLRTSAALTYSLSRSLALKGEFRNERLFSNVAGQDYTANIGLIGIRMQR